MKSHEASGKPWLEKLTLENYLNLEHMDTISIHILRKILMIHGFKCYNVPKDDLLDAVRSIELMEVHRSTLQSDVSSNAFLSLNDVIRDLSLLPWQECCITHIESINSVTDFAEKPTIISVTDFGEKQTINSVTDFGEKPSPKRLKPNCNRNTVVNGPDTLGLHVGEKPTIISVTDFGENPTINSVTDFGEKPSPKRLKPNCNRNNVVNGPDTLGLQKQILDQNSTIGDTATKRSDRVKKAPTKWKDFVMGATLPPN